MLLNEWKPTKKQAEFLAIPVTVKEAFFGGGAGSGKSDVLLVYGIVHRWHEHPLFKQVFMRNTHQSLKKEIVARSREFYSKFGATFNKTDMCWTFPRQDQIGAGWMGNAGAQIFLGHCEEDKDVHIYDSMQISLYSPDELTNLNEYRYLYLAFERNRSPKDSGLPSITRSAGMPGGIGHSFVNKRFILPYKEGGRIIVGKGGNKRIFIRATLHDNPHIDPTYEQSLKGRPDAEIKAKLYGDFDAYLGQVFDEFRDKKYPDEPDNALHVIEPFNIPDWWPKFTVIDWGFAAMCYAGFYAVSPTGRLYLYRELHWLKTDISDWAPVIKSFDDREHYRLIKVCRSAGQDRGQEQTIQEQIESILERSIELSNNAHGSRVAGKMLVHEYLRWKPRPIIPADQMPVYDDEKARWILRNKGLEEYKAYLNIFKEPEEEKDLPKLQIFCCSEDEHDGHPNCCPTMITSIKSCSYDKPKNNKPSEDVAEFEGDDPYDDLRYACDTAHNFFDEASSEFKKLRREAEIINKLMNDKDFTAYYRNMRTMESEEIVKPVGRFHHRR